MVVIGEEYLLMNLLMDTLCLTAAMRLSSLRARPGRIALAALAGALLSMIALSLWGLRASAYAALPIAVLMALLAFGLRRAPGGSARLLIAGLLSAAVSPLTGRLLEQGYWFYRYHYTILPVLLMIPIFLLLGYAIPAIMYRHAAKQSVVERLREAEA